MVLASLVASSKTNAVETPTYVSPGASAKKSAQLIKGEKAIYYPGAPHGLTTTQDQVNAELLAFVRS